MFITRQHIEKLSNLIWTILRDEMVGATLARDCTMPTIVSWDQFCRMCDGIEASNLTEIRNLWRAMRAAIRTHNRRELTGLVAFRGELLRTELRTVLDLARGMLVSMPTQELSMVEQETVNSFGS